MNEWGHRCHTPHTSIQPHIRTKSSTPAGHSLCSPPPSLTCRSSPALRPPQTCSRRPARRTWWPARCPGCPRGCSGRNCRQGQRGGQAQAQGRDVAGAVQAPSPAPHRGCRASRRRRLTQTQRGGRSGRRRQCRAARCRCGRGSAGPGAWGRGGCCGASAQSPA